MREACGATGLALKPYQLVGVNFLLLLHTQGITGAILADEMARRRRRRRRRTSRIHR